MKIIILKDLKESKNRKIRIKEKRHENEVKNIPFNEDQSGKDMRMRENKRPNNEHEKEKDLTMRIRMEKT